MVDLLSKGKYWYTVIVLLEIHFVTTFQGMKDRLINYYFTLLIIVSRFSSFLGLNLFSS